MTSYSDPDRQAWEVFKGLPRDQPIQMLNLIRLKPRAEYPEGHPDHGRDLSGADAYRAYGRAIGPVFEKLGARQVWAGVPQVMVTGPASEGWELAFIAEYPSTQAFIDMVRDPHYREQVVPHRTAAVADSRLLCLSPLAGDGDLGH
ncbi:DUF1330 domain-containing protein [uncultured Phenylobacterium sp.]|uniref:DUF1330 domain-containing protein n=1 Tax=uncultured Phenylobacterium sp. TaxID=349273 RepID=UPI0025E80BC6|nr:DUF1330 domain-containing protein [uncultured Phenylobacterium sp.]